MKNRSSKTEPSPRANELKGVVKRMAGKLTNDPEMEREGSEEMLGRRDPQKVGRLGESLNPDPHRRG